MTEGGSERKIQIRLSEDIHRHLRLRCSVLDVTIQDSLAGVIEDSLEVTSKKSKARRKRRSWP